MVETYARPRFGEPREPKNRVNPGSRLAGLLDLVAASHLRAALFLLACGLVLFLPGFFNIPPIDRDEARTMGLHQREDLLVGADLRDGEAAACRVHHRDAGRVTRAAAEVDAEDERLRWYTRGHDDLAIE